ncbi:protein-L-isoaspartate O-methyltransferase domain-containing protein 2-like isoform X2 [Euwallacea similis]|uniref:protein-L-isoaspartate O-methyltransferase domain-containing protein 2-like isoform X2 n=1 Tax=Euwallacea similis TaxID=1736056 RepID=UPI00344F374B
MGGAVSSGSNNDELIDNLLEADYIKSSQTERIFRAVDRAEYFLPEARGTAYKDLAWKSGNLHISAPCIYSKVMEELNLTSGISFLNLGSGTGYFSTMVGLILGSNGINHGIELHEDVIEYANKKLEDFKEYSGAVDEFDFCEPKFIQGNCLCLSTECSNLYDRIYCGAACPEEYEPYMKNLMKIGGILVMPLNDQLLQIKRLSESQWKVRSLLPVSFASLIIPPEGWQDFIKPIDIEPLSLQVLCRSVVRNILRHNIEKEHPPAKKNVSKPQNRKKRALRRMVVPLFDGATAESSDDENRVGRVEGERRHMGRALFRSGESDGIFRFFMGMGMNRGESGDTNRGEDSDNNRNRLCPASTMKVNDHGNSNSRESNEPSCHEVRAVIEHNSDNDDPQGNGDMEANDIDDLKNTRLVQVRDIEETVVEYLNDAITQVLEGRVLEEEEARVEGDRSALPGENDLEWSSQVGTKVDGGVISTAASQRDFEPQDPQPGTSCSPQRRRAQQREKIDRGLGDEIVEVQSSSDDENMKLETISSCDEDYSLEKCYKRGTQTNTNAPVCSRIERHHLMESSSSSSSSDFDEQLKVATDDLRVFQSPYTEYMRACI